MNDITQKLELGIEGLDKNYEEFFKKSKQLLEEIEDKDKITAEEIKEFNSFFRDYLEKHFTKEEALQQELDYPYYEEHRRSHKVLYNRINGLISDLKPEKVDKDRLLGIYNEIRSIFKVHINYIDQKFENWK